MERLLLLLPALGVNGQQGRPPPCSGSFLQENITLEVSLRPDPLPYSLLAYYRWALQ